MRRPILPTAIAGAALALAACSGDGTGPAGGGTLSAAELAQLNQAILGVSAALRDGQGASLSTGPTAQNTGSLELTVDRTLPCQSGGSVAVAGGMRLAWDQAAGTGSVSSEFAVTHAACAHRLENGETITLTGDPDIDVTLEATSGPGGPTSLLIRETGAFTWAKGSAASGRCTLDVTAQLDPATGAVALSGSFCGFPVTGTLQG